jgi:L-2,4-diaminobutyric acid acetyltransferase
VILRPPTAHDGARVWQLLGRTGGLERNTAYAYLLLCSHFADTSLVAEAGAGADLAGFVLAYRPPARPGEVFVWQIGVAPEARGAGLGGHLLEGLIALPGCAGVTHLTATVGPSNRASRALFAGFARRRGVPCEVGPGFTADLFPEPHEAEELLRIGPLGPVKG